MKSLKIKLYTVVLLILSAWIFNSCQNSSENEQKYYDIAHNNGIIVNEGYNRCMNYVTDWLKIADPETGLIPQNLNKGKDVWNGHNSAADNYPFMVLTSYILDDSLLHGRMLDI